MFSYYCLAHEQAENYITNLKQKYEFEVKYRNLDRPDQIQLILQI